MKKLKQVAAYCFLALLALFVLLPICFMVAASVQTNEAIFSIPFRWLPRELQLENYKDALQDAKVLVYFKNSLVVASIATAANLVVSAAGGYGMVRCAKRQRRWLEAVLVVLLMLPTQALIFPLFLMMSSAGLADTLLALILPGVASPFSVFFMKQYFSTFPTDMLEAARMDGASELQMFLRLVLPCALPALSALAIFQFLFNWNNFLWPLIILKSDANFTIPIGITKLYGDYRVPYGTLMAAATLVSLPVLFLYLLFQEPLMKGAMLQINEPVEE